MRTEALTSLTIRPMSVADIGRGMDLVRMAGWNQTAEDWAMMLELGQGFGIADEAGRLQATSVVLPYAEHFGWIGMVLVDEVERGQGFATQLLNNAIEVLPSKAWCRCSTPRRRDGKSTAGSASRTSPAQPMARKWHRRRTPRAIGCAAGAGRGSALGCCLGRDGIRCGPKVVAGQYGRPGRQSRCPCRAGQACCGAVAVVRRRRLARSSRPTLRMRSPCFRRPSTALWDPCSSMCRIAKRKLRPSCPRAASKSSARSCAWRSEAAA